MRARLLVGVGGFLLGLLVQLGNDGPQAGAVAGDASLGGLADRARRFSGNLTKADKKINNHAA
ncbi:hypothetical protein OG535_38585 [Kitasatospora sp. NBC_00085]|uniref:hypothetical protein n=1 Tax=unclassified Kitasatospora TaxID=2633591 RepID=UPI00325176C6